MFVIAHRGANQFAPQNTIHAFNKAVELRSDGVETDIQITKDGQLVLCHDKKVNRTSNGKGKISALLLSDIRELDFGSWFGKKYSDTKIPTIDEFLDCASGSPLKLLDIELKPQKKNEADAVTPLLEKINEYGIADKTLISSFDYKLLERVKEINPDITTGYLFPSMSQIVRRKFIKPYKLAIKHHIDCLLPHYGYVTKKMIDKSHELGLKVGVWTVNKLETAADLIEWGADGLITDVPDIMLNKIENY